MDEEDRDASILSSCPLFEEPCEISKVLRHQDPSFGLCELEEVFMSSAR
jgi:hypothetical protein